jgi:hypothetical protein
MVKVPGKSATRNPAKPASGGVKGMNLPPAIKTEIRRIIREEVAKATKQGK